MLNRDSFLQAQDLKTVDVDVPEHGGTLRLRMMTAAERNSLHAAASAGGAFDPTTFQSTLIELTAINEDGSRLFVPGDAALIAGKASTVTSRIFEAASKLNGLGASATDEAEKNSAAAPSVASS